MDILTGQVSPDILSRDPSDTEHLATSVIITDIVKISTLTI